MGTWGHGGDASRVTPRSHPPTVPIAMPNCGTGRGGIVAAASTCPFHPDPEVEATAKRLAEVAVMTAAEQHGLTLDLSDDSIRLVEQVVAQLRETCAGDQAWQQAQVWGSYFGEVYRRNHGGTWGVTELFDALGGRTIALRIVDGPGHVHELYPWNRAYQRIVRTADPDEPDQGLWVEYQNLVSPPPPPWDSATPPDPEELASLLALARSPDRLYPVVSHKHYGFYAGRLADGRQALVTVGMRDALHVHFFDPAGDFLGVEQLTPQFEREPEEPYLDRNDEELHAFLQAELGFRPDRIRIKRVEHADAEFSIEPMPESYEDFLRDPNQDWMPDEHRRAQWYHVHKWLKEGEFVLLCGNDYWLDQTGEVTSS